MTTSFTAALSPASITIASGILSSARRTPEKTAIREGGRALTYARLAQRILQVANLGSEGYGLRPGDRAAVLLPNCLEYVELVCGLSSIGVAVAAIGPAAASQEIAFVCADSGARVLFVSKALEDSARASVPASVEHICVIGTGYENALASASERPFEDQIDWETPFSIPYTSGSTGRPKGVLLSHRARVLSAYAMAAEHGCYGPDDRAIATTPMFHGAGLLMAIAPIFFGGFVELLPAFDVLTLMRAIETNGATSAYMVPTHFSSLFALGEEGGRFDTRSLKALVVGTAPLSQAMKERIVERFGPGKLYERYGSTEASIVTALRPADQLRKKQCVGLPLPATEVKIVDEAGSTVGVGEVGEVFSRSPYMFSGYLNHPDATAAAMRDGWFSAGDLGRVDDEGYLYLVDRKNDMIITGGENVYPREIEEALLEHPAIAEAGVVGMPHDHWGEQVVATLVLRSRAEVSADELKSFLLERVSRYKIPKMFRFVESLPRNRLGKLDRRALRG